MFNPPSEAAGSSRTSAYRLEASDISVVSEEPLRLVRPLSSFSSVVRNLTEHPIEIARLYARPENAAAARARVADLLKDTP